MTAAPVSLAVVAVVAPLLVGTACGSSHGKPATEPDASAVDSGAGDETTIEAGRGVADAPHDVGSGSRPDSGPGDAGALG